VKPGSLRSRLRYLILGVIALVLLPLGVVSIKRTIREVAELSDGRLAQSARTLQTMIGNVGLDTIRRKAGEGGVVIPIETKSTQEQALHEQTYESEVGFQVFDMQGRLLMVTGNIADLPPPTLSHVGYETWSWAATAGACSPCRRHPKA